MDRIPRRQAGHRRSIRWLALASLIALAAGCGQTTSTVAPADSSSAGASIAPSSGQAGASVAPSSGLADNDSRRPATKGGEGTVALAAGSIDHLEPTLWYFQTTWQIAYATCTTLVRYPDQPGQAGAKIEAGLADLPVVSADGSTYTFTLRPGVKFKGGAPITGADIKYTFERMLNPALASPGAGFFTNIEGASSYMAGKADSVSGITADGNTVTFKLTDPPASFLARLTMPFSCPVPAGTPISAVEDGSLLGTGPYMVESYTPQREIVLVRNPDYPADVLGQRGALDKIRIDTTIDPTQAALVIRSGEIATYMDLIAGADGSQALGDPTLAGRVFADPIATVTFLWINTQEPPFDNPKVRQAMNYAINRNDIQRVLGGPASASVTDQILPPTMAGWKDADIYPAAGDPEKAKQLLAEAGVTLPIKTLLRTGDNNPGMTDIAQTIQAQLKAVGIEVEVAVTAGAVDYAITTTVANRTPMGVDPWSQDYPHPDDFIGVLLDGTRITPTNNQNRAMFNEPTINDRIHELSASLDPSTEAAWNDLDVQIMRDYAPWVPLVNSVRVTIVAEGYCGLLIHPVYQLDLTTLGHCP
ncbi:MAG: peptide/nickel transport system substrate-binding protein [Chloroflexota bacterium]|nr:peptide/nickel transport system substrate-binding protein [Chloroflexota bacterium]